MDTDRTVTGVRVRAVQESDCDLLWRWANDPETRQASYRSSPIPYDEHVRWFAKRPARFWYIAESDAPAGLVRFDPEDDHFRVSLVIAPERRGQGYARPILVKALETFRRDVGHNCRIAAYIKQSNLRSRRAFESAGFKLELETAVQESASWKLSLTLP